MVGAGGGLTALVAPQAQGHHRVVENVVVRRWLAGAVALLVLAGCGSAPVARPTPSPSPPPSASASPLPSPTPPPAVAAGAPAWVAVSVASGWRSPSSPRPVDAPALANPVAVGAWMAAMTGADKTGLIGRLDTQALLGDEVMVLQLQAGWAKVAVMDQATPLDARGYPVWIPVRQLTAGPPPESDRLLTVTARTTVLHSNLGTFEISFGTTLPFLGRQGSNDWVGLPAGGVGLIPASAATVGKLPATGSSIVATARAFMGLPYLWGGTSGYGYDCSGLVHEVFQAHGIVLPRDSDPQSKAGVAVSRWSLQPGDLVFFSSGGVAYHVAIYSGNGMVIESPQPGASVHEVSLAGMAVIGDYSGARRVTGSAPVPSPTPSGLPASLAGAEWSRLPTTDKVVALTFDAGGNDAGVAPVLTALAAAGVPATFFLTGRWTEVYPADARKIASLYPIGNHTYSHPRLTDLTDAQAKAEVVRAESVIKSSTGRDPRPLFRFPYGSSDARVLADVHSLGYGGIRWTVDTLGWEGRSLGQSEATVVQRVLANLQPGEIVLMHVGAATDGTTLDASALPAMIRELQARGYRLVLVGDYVGR